MTTTIKRYSIMVAGASIGLVASFWQTLEKLTLLKNKDAVLNCNLDSVFSCSNVLNAPQSSVFGFPNSILSVVLFTIFLSIGLVGLFGGQISKRLRLIIQGMSLFTLGFGIWFLFQSTYRIGSICIFCMINLVGLLLVNSAWLRLNASDLPLSEAHSRTLQKWMKRGADTFGWVMVALVVGAAIFLKFYA